MSDAEPRRRSSRLRKWLAKWLIRGSVGAAVVLAALYLLRRPLFEDLLRDTIVAEVKEAADLTLEIDEIAGSWVGGVVVRGVRVVDQAPNDELRVGQIDELQVRYSLLGLLDDPLAALKDLSASGVRVEIVVNDEPGDWDDTEETLRSLFALPLDRLPPGTIDGFLSIRDGDFLIESGLELETGGDGLAVGLRDVRTEFAFGEFNQPSFDTVIEATASELRTVGALAGDGLVIDGLRLHDDDDRVELVGTLHFGGGDTHLTLWRDGIDADLENIAFDDLPPLVEVFVGDALDGGVLESGHIELRRRAPAQFSRVRVRDLVIDDLEFDEVTAASGTFDGEIVTFEDVAARRGVAGATLASGSLDLDQPLRSLAWNDMRLEVGDLSETLRELIDPDLSVPLTAGAQIVITAPLLENGRAELAFEGSSSHSSAKGTAQVVMPSVDDLRSEQSAAALRRALESVSAQASLDLRDLLAIAPAEWELPESTGVLEIDGQGRDPISGRSGTVSVKATNVRIDEHAVRRLDLRAKVDDQEITIEEFVADTPYGSARASGALHLADEGARMVAFELNAPQLAELDRLLPQLAPMRGSLEAKGTVGGGLIRAIDVLLSGSTDVPESTNLFLELSGERVRTRDADLGTVTARVAMHGRRVTVDEFYVDGGLATATFHGEGRVDGREIDIRDLDASVPRLESFARWLPGLKNVRGSIRLNGNLQMDDLRNANDMDGEIDLTSETLEAAGHRFRDVRLDARADAGTIRVTEFAATSPWGEIKGGGGLRLDEGRIEATLAGAHVALERSVLGLDGAPISISIRGPVEVEWDADRIDVRNVRAELLGGELTATIGTGTETSIEATVSEIDLAALEPELSGRLSAELSAVGQRGAPKGRLKASVPILRWGDDEGRIAIDVTQSDDGITVDSFVVDAGPRLSIDGGGFAPYHVSLVGVSRASETPASLFLDATCVNPAPWLLRIAPAGTQATSATARVRASGGNLEAHATVQDLAWIDAEDDAGVSLPGATTVEVNAGPDGFAARLAGESEDLAIDGELSSPQGVDWRSPQSLFDDLLDAPVAGEVRVVVPHLRGLARWVDVLRRINGTARLDTTIGGTLRTLELTGQISADDVVARAEIDLPDIDRGRLRAVLEGSTVRIEELTARLGYSPVEVTGSIDLSELTDPTFDLHVTGENAQILRTPAMRVRANLDTRVTGPLSGLLIAGEVEVADALYTQPVDFLARKYVSENAGFQLFSVREPPLSKARFDVHVTALDSIVVDNNVVRGRFSADLQLGGTGRVPRPVGRAEFDDVRVRLPLSRMTIDRGTVVFPADNPFDPQLRLGAFARLQGYDLDIRVRGGFSDARIFIATSPPLSQEDAMFLLATGAAPQGTGVGGAAVSGAGSVLGEATMAWLEGGRPPGEDSLVDRITLEVGRERSETGLATVEAEVRIFPRWYLRFERDRWDHYDAGILWRIRFR